MSEERQEKYKAVELRSEEVQEIMGQIPSWIVRWGITILFLIVFVILIGSFFFKYPDVITAEMTLTSPNPVAHIVARSSGRLSHIYTHEGQEVRPNDLLAVIENPAIIQDVFLLESKLQRAIISPDNARMIMASNGELALGDVQGDYINYVRILNDYINYRDLEYYPQKINSVKYQISRYRKYFQNQSRQHAVIESQYALAQQQYARDSLLFTREVISPSEHETARTEFLQSSYSLEGSAASLENLQIQIAQLEETLLDLELQQLEKETVLYQDYRTALEQLQNGLNSWRLSYCLSAPIQGTVTFTKYWGVNQNVTNGETIFTVVPEEEGLLMGVASLPLARSGKVKTGQRVIIRMHNFPDQEFGIVNGVVSSISLVPNEDNYRVEIELPEGLVTNYGNELPVSREMLASAEIVTEELRLIERFFQPIKKILKEGF